MATHAHPYDDLNVVAALLRGIGLEGFSSVTRVPEGMSTAIYRVETSGQTYYLRILPEEDASFAPEVETHRRLLDLGLHVPRVVHFEQCNELVQRSVMLTTAIPGKAIGYRDQPASTSAILREAGRELAILNQVRVEGFGWVDEVSNGEGLRAEYRLPSMWLDGHFNEPISALSNSYQNDTNTSNHFDMNKLDKIYRILEFARQRFDRNESFLAHGDFDVTHIFYDNERYTGMIDFGEIRGAHRLYDLGHFEIENSHLLNYLTDGYEEVNPLGDAAMPAIRLTGVLIAARRIGRCVLQGRNANPSDVSFVKRALENLESWL